MKLIVVYVLVLCCIPALSAYPNARNDISEVNRLEEREVSTEIAAAKHKRTDLQTLIFSYRTLNFAMSMFSWVWSSWTVGHCQENDNCLRTGAGLAFDSYLAFFAYYNIFALGRRGDDLPPITGIAQRADNVTLVSHIPFNNGTRYFKALENWGRDNGQNWTHVVTRYHYGLETHRVYYRLWDEASLGAPNGGSYHELQTRPTGNTTMLRKRQGSGPDESDYEGVVVSYAWDSDASEEETWDYEYDENVNQDPSLGEVMGDYTADWMEAENSEVTCATIQAQINGEYMYANQGIMAYGWNDAAFDYAGRGQGWLSQC